MSRLLQWRGHAWVSLPARLYLGFVFIYASLHKIADPGGFAIDVATYQFLPLSFINIFALVLPWLEVVVGAMIVIGFRTRAAALLISAMMVAFIVALAWALWKGLDMSCGCFASAAAADPISGLTLLRDVGWLALSLYVLICDRRPLGLDLWIFRKRRVPSAG